MKKAALLLLLCAATLPADQSVVDGFAAMTYRDASGQTMPYRLFVPESYAKEQQYALVVWLHGGAGRGSDNLRQISGGNTAGTRVWTRPENQAKYPSLVLAPQCPSNSNWVGPDYRPTEELRMVVKLIEEVEREYSIDRERIYVSGQSMGGYGTWALLAEHPKLFAAGLPVCGGGDLSKTHLIAHTPVWVFHGDEDEMVGVAKSRVLVEALRNAGGQVRYSEYAGVGHNSWEKAFAEPDLLPWVFAQKRTNKP
ncbi:MAG TPA: prolyl oligopeptidase family serine peptidase [Candidatus Acidoferrales bacterium]|nr:prolyl oligopeptidase family serine peptidase [Candidatus Acidoferrales bacterium]